MLENRDEQTRYEIEEELLSPPQATMDAHDINAINVVNGSQFIGQQFIINDGDLPFNVTLSAQAREPAFSSKSPPFFPPQHDIPFFTGREDELKQLENVLLNPSGPRVAGIVGL